MNYKEKNILFSVDGIYGYKESLEETLKKKFKNVYYIENYMPIKKTITFKILRELNNLFKNTFLGKFFKKIFDEKCRKFYLNNIINFQEKIDYFLVVAGREFSKEFIQDLKKINPEIKCIIFLWDKIEYSSLKNSINEFEYIFSFDRDDCKKYGYIFRPIFYPFPIEEIKSFYERKYDLSYIGALRDMKRYLIVEKIYTYSTKKNLSYFIKLVYDKNFKNSSKFIREIITPNKISMKDNLEILKDSKVTIDIPFSKQTGLTIRVIQSLFLNIKIITTNQDIKNYDFYDENNILIIDENNNLSKKFFTEEYKPIEKNILIKYTTEGFLIDIFNTINRR